MKKILLVVCVMLFTGCGNDNEQLVGKWGMVLIPAGKFLMGSGGLYVPYDEKPVHTVYLDAFYMDVYEVSNKDYKKFMDATKFEAPKYLNEPTLNQPDQPVVGVSWDDAVAYADWVGKRLPTEAEWEKAARGGLVGKEYPSGDTLYGAKYDCSYCNTVWECTAPVGSYLPNGYGLYDMAGNASEWCNDWYNKDYYAVSSKSNPEGPDYEEDDISKTFIDGKKVIRGGSWPGNEYSLRVAKRYSYNPTNRSGDVGFRCVQDVVGGSK